MTTLIFDLQSSIHFEEVRSALIRIPEVIQKIRTVQEILDAKGVSLDLSNFIASEDTTFLHHYRRKEFASVVIQLGLFDRYLRFFSPPDEVVGVVNSISAVRVLSGELSLEQLVDEAFRRTKCSAETEELPGLPVLSGIQIPKYGSFAKNEESFYSSVRESCADLSEVRALKEKNAVVYEVGLGSSSRQGTVELDPYLNWVWDQIRSSKELLAAN